MINIFKNSGLVLVLAGLLTLPLVGFQSLKYQPEVVPQNVLGAKTIQQPKSEIKMVDQIDLNLYFSKDLNQKFYNVLPENYLESDYKVVVVYPVEIKDQGVKIEVIKNDLSADLNVTFNDKDPMPESFIVSLIILR